MATSTTTSGGIITLKGSTDIVKEFFHFSINNILYQRGIYPPESFKRVAQYGLPLMITTDEELLRYLFDINKQLEVWLIDGSVQKLVLVVKGSDSGDILERWVFDVECKRKPKDSSCAEELKSDKPLKEITSEIQAIMRQITASVTFLPMLNEPCCFDLLVYADKEATVPLLWEDSDPCLIQNGEQVRMRSFNTKIHKVDLAISYRLDDSAL